MRLQRHRRRDPEVNMTPLIDVVLTLIIFFMVSTTFNRQGEIELELPEADASEVQAERVQLDITIDAKGRYYVNQQEVINTQPETLKRAIGEALEGGTQPIVVLSADRLTPHQAVITAMDVARQLGLTQLTFATTNPPDAP